MMRRSRSSWAWLLRQVMYRRIFAGEGDLGDPRYVHAFIKLAHVLSPAVVRRRLAGLAAELLGEPAIRIYHDNALSKEPGERPAPCPLLALVA